MIGKKINQLATELAPTTTDLTIIGDPVTGVSKKITLEQLGAIFGGAISFYTTLGDFPATGVIDIIYCAKDTQKLYLWSGSAYVEVFPSQSLLNTYQLRSEKGVSNGYASLDVNGKVPIGQLPNSIMEYKGTWNAATNTPTLANGTGDTGDVYICNAAGTVNFGAGPITFAVGDYVVYSGTIWQRSSGAVGTVTSVGLSITGDAIGVTGSPITTSGTLALAFAGTSSQYINGAGNLTTFPTLLSSVGLSMPSAFSVANSPLTANGTIAVTGAGNATQYVRGDGQLATLPTNGSGGGASVSYYLNGSINQGTIGGVTYYEMNKTPIIGAGTDFSRSTNGYIASFLTDANDPALLNIPAGNWNFETYFEASSGGGSPTFYIELYKYDGSTFTLIASNSATPKLINDGVNIEAYFSALAVPQTTLTLTDRLSVRIYVTTAGRTITLHTENGHLCQVITTFTTGLTALNGLTEQVQYLATGTSGTDFNISSVTATHTFNLPTASATNRGALSSADWTTFNSKQNALNGTGFVKISGTTISYDNSTYYLASNPNSYIALTNLSAGAGISYNNTTGVIASTITQYTDALARAAISLTTTGTSGAATYNNTTGVLNIPQYQTALTNPVTGTGTTNYLPKFTGTSTIGNSLVFDNGTNVGIATNNPVNGKLDVRGDAGSFAGYFLGGNTTSTSFGVGISAGTNSSDFALLVRNRAETSTLLQIMGSGNVGIGVTPSAWGSNVTALELPQSVSLYSWNASAVPQLYLGANHYWDGSNWRYKITGQASTLYYQAVGQHQWFNAPSGTAGNAISFTQAMTLNASGNLSIGNTNDTYKLDVSGTGMFRTTSTTPAIRVLLPGNSNATLLSSVDPSGYGWQFQQDEVSTGDFRIFRTLVNTSYQVLNIARLTGAATFSSSVTAGSGLFGSDFLSNETSKVGIAFESGYGKINAWGANTSTYGGLKFQISASNGGTATPLIIIPSGNVGINTTAPTSKLFIAAAENQSTLNAGANAHLVLNSYQVSGQGPDMVFGTAQTGGPYGYIQMRNALVNGFSYNLVLNPSGGNVGIGTASPSSFSGYTTLSISGNNGGVLDLMYNGTSQMRLSAENGNNYISGVTNAPMLFYTNSTERMRITSGGAVEMTGTIKTASPSSGSAHPWKLGSYAAGGTGTATGVIYIEVNGQIYSIPALLGTP